jgi:hypothetical protein
MDEQEARRILGDWIQSDSGLYCLGQYVAWSPQNNTVCLDSDFTIEELEAIVWWVREVNRKMDLVKRLLNNGIEAYLKSEDNASWEGFLEHVKEVAAKQKAINNG